MEHPTTPPQPDNPRNGNDQPTVPQQSVPGQQPTQQYPTSQYPPHGQPAPQHGAPGHQPTQQYAAHALPGGPGPGHPAGARYPAPVGGPAAQPTAPQAVQPRPVQSQAAGPATTLTLGRSSRTAWRTIIGIVGALALILPVSAMAFTGTSLVGLVHEESTHDLPLEADALAVDVAAATVRVTVGDEFDAPVAHVSHVGQESRSTTPQIEDANGATTLTLEGRDRSADWFPGVAGEETIVEIELPTEYAQELALDVVTRWGFTEVIGEFGSVNAMSEAGAMSLDVIAQDAAVETGAGYIDVTGTMDTLSMESTTGYLETQRVNVSQELTAHTRTGGMDLTLGESAVPVEGISATTTTGMVDVNVPREDRVRGQNVDGYSVDADTNNGTASIDITETKPGDGVVPITASASSGDVYVSYADPQTVYGDPDDDTDAEDEANADAEDDASDVDDPDDV